jgi:hypothetical protein
MKKVIEELDEKEKETPDARIIDFIKFDVTNH